MTKKHQIVHSSDATTVVIQGDIRNPEPSHAIIVFPGGFVEVARTSDGNYWAHLSTVLDAPVLESRIDYTYEGYTETSGSIPDVPHADKIKHIAVKIGRGQA